MSSLSPMWFVRAILIAISVVLFFLGFEVVGWIVLGIWLILFVIDFVRRRRRA